VVKPVCPTEIRTGFLPSASRTLILVGLPNVGNLRVSQKTGVVRATVTLATTCRTAGCGVGEDRLKVIRFGGEFAVDSVASRTKLMQSVSTRRKQLHQILKSWLPELLRLSYYLTVTISRCWSKRVRTYIKYTTLMFVEVGLYLFIFGT